MSSFTRSRFLTRASAIVLCAALTPYQAFARAARSVSRTQGAPVVALPGAALTGFSEQPALSLPLSALGADLSLAPLPDIGAAAAPAAQASLTPVAAEAIALGGDAVGLPAAAQVSPRGGPMRGSGISRRGDASGDQRGDSDAPVSLMERLRLPSLLKRLSPRAGHEEASASAAADFALRLGERTSGAEVPAGAYAPSAPALASPGGVRTDSGPEPRPGPVPDPGLDPRAKHRSALFTPILTAAAAVLTAMAAAAYWATASFAPAAAGGGAAGTLTTVLSAGAAVFGGAVAVFGALAVWDLGLFFYTMARGKGVGDREFWEFTRTELRRWNLHPSVVSTLLGQAPGRGIIKPYRPIAGRWSFSFGFALGSSIYLRPEIIRIPWLFRQVLKHELRHYGAHFGRDPPPSANPILRFFGFLASEILAHFGELRRLKALRAMRVPVIERVLHDAQLSLQFPDRYDVLVVRPSAEGMTAPESYGPPSAGNATVVGAFADAAPSAAELSAYLKRGENRGRFRVAVVPGAHGFLPAARTPQGTRLAAALKQIDDVYLLSQRMRVSGMLPAENALERREFERLTGMILKMRRSGRLDSRRLESILTELIHRISQEQLTGLEATGVLEGLYKALPNKGVALLPFSASDPDLETVEKLCRYWRASDKGGFSVARVDLAEGGHVVVLRKAEPRVQMWLKPQNGHTIAVSRANVSSDPALAGQERAILLEAGFSDQEIERFLKAGMSIRHVFAADAGNRIFVTVPRAQAKVLKRYAEQSGIGLTPSEGGFKLHLADSGPIQGLPEVWKSGLTGQGGLIHDTDTGLDATHPDFAGRGEWKDLVEEGPEDWIGHGSHKAGISYAAGVIHRGMAPEARGRMGKVFSRSGLGASDGDIKASALIDAMQWGADVESQSLGSPGTSDSPLAEDMSQMTERENSRGHKPIVTASAGNSGPFNNTLSQPSVGVHVVSVAAAAKSLDDGVPETSFFSSVGFAEDYRYGRLRWRLKPEITALGGDVTTPKDVRDVYQHGIESVKSKDMPVSPSDAADGKHTRMSGTSMSNPMIAAVALLVKQAALLAARAGSEARAFLMENLPFAVKMILMRSSKDMNLPVSFQGAGFVDAPAAVRTAAETFGSAALSLWGKALVMLRLAQAPAAPKEAPWAWIARARAVWTAEDRVFEGAFAAASEAAAAAVERIRGSINPDVPPEGPDAAKKIRKAVGDAANAALEKRFAELTAGALPELLKALSDEVWLTRMYAAFALMNLRAPAAVDALAQAALGDPDARVRQVAFLALADTPTYAVDELLRSALAHPQADVALYAAYALARHGDGSGVARIVEAARGGDKKVRFSAVWLLGRLGRRSTRAASDALARSVKPAEERGNIRHLAVASLAEIALAKPEAVSDEAVLTLLSEAGPQNFALTRTISKFFGAAVRSKALRERMRAEPLKGAITDFIYAYKSTVGRPGVLGELVALLARVLDIPLDLPAPLPNPDGVGVRGVDPHLGPLHLLVELPASGAARIDRFADLRGAEPAAALAAASAAGLDPQAFVAYGARIQTAMPVSQSLWVEVPESKAVAFSEAMEAQGNRVRRAAPVYASINDTGRLSGAAESRAAHGLSGAGVLVLYVDEGGDPEHPALAGKVDHKLNFSGEGGPADVADESVSHGTHGMTIVGGSSVDGSPYVGMAPGARFAVIKVLGANGGSEAAVMAGLEAGAALVADPLKTPVLANLSLGGPGRPDSPLSRLVTRLALKNVGVVAAAGNEGPADGTVGSPANAPLAVSIGAVDKKGALTFYSSRGRRGGPREVSRVNYGGAVDFHRKNPYEIVAGLSTRLAEAAKDAAGTVLWKGRPLYLHMSGTSMAAPHESGHLALGIERMLRAFPEGLPDGYLLWLDALFSRTARALPDQDEHEVGAGRTDLPAALAEFDRALQDPARVRAESEALIAKARAEHGGQAPLEPGEGWYQRLHIGELVRRIAAASLFLAPLLI